MAGTPVDSTLKLPPMTVAHLARTLATARERARKEERTRCVQMVEDMRDTVRNQGEEGAAILLDALAEAMRADLTELPAPVSGTAEAMRPMMDESELPAVHHMDDFAEGAALVQGGMHRRAITGYTGRLGHLRGD
jgi:hypothetical protein